MRWTPLALDFLLEKHGLKDRKVQYLLAIWVILIAVCLFFVLSIKPDGRYTYKIPNIIYHFYKLQLPVLMGTLLLFWMGFEWGFIPVFLSAFLVAFTSFMTYYWALLYGISFVLGLTIYGLAYYCIPIDITLRSFKSIAFFIIVSFIASLGSSLGSFVWSEFFNLSVTETSIMWRGWWTGLFLQSLMIVAPLLLIFTPVINRLKRRYFAEPDASVVSLNWIYSAIGSVAVILILFIAGAKMLGAESMSNQLSMFPDQARQNLQSANDSFEIVAWISIGLVLATGVGGIYLVGSWNKNLQDQVDKQTLQIKENEEKLKTALDERDLLLKEIHDRVRHNLTIMMALLELQLKNDHGKPLEDVVKESHSRIRSLAIIHEIMHQTESVSRVNLKNYAIKLSNRLRRSFLKKDQAIYVSINADDIEMGIDRAVPLALILNELLFNAYSHAFRGLAKGAIFVMIKRVGDEIILNVRDNGLGLPDNFAQIEKHTLGMKLIKTLSKQLKADFRIDDSQKPSFVLHISSEELAFTDNTLADI